MQRNLKSELKVIYFFIKLEALVSRNRNICMFCVPSSGYKKLTQKHQQKNMWRSTFFAGHVLFQLYEITPFSIAECESNISTIWSTTMLSASLSLHYLKFLIQTLTSRINTQYIFCVLQQALAIRTSEHIHVECILWLKYLVSIVRDIAIHCRRMCK